MNPTTNCTSALCYCPDTEAGNLLCATCSDALAILLDGYRTATRRHEAGSLSHAGKVMRQLRIRQTAKRLGLLSALREELAR